MDTHVLEDIGLSNVDIKVFITLLGLGESKSGVIIEKSGLQSSSVHYALNNLINRGLVSYVQKSKIKYYQAADPESIAEYIELKKREFMQILPELKEKQSKRELYGVEFFKSIKGIRTMMIKMLSDAENNEIYRTFAIQDKEESEFAINRLFAPLKELRDRKKLVAWGIFHENSRKPASKSTKIKKRYLNMPLPPSTTILGNKVAIISWENEPYGILISSKSIADQYKMFFDGLWKIGKP